MHGAIKQMAERALEILDDNLNQVGVDPKLRTSTAFDVLDRAGYRKSDRPLVIEGDLNISQTNIENLSDRELQKEVMTYVDDSA